MKVLFLTARFPFPPDRGDRLNAFHLLRSLAIRHRVTLLSFVDGSETEAARETLRALCERVETIELSRARSWIQAAMGMFSPAPSQVCFYRSNSMRDRVHTLVRQEHWDLIYVQLFRMAPFAAGVDHPSKVLFLTDSIALALERRLRYQPWWQRPLLEWERTRVSRFEVAATRAFRESWVVSAVDASHLAARGAERVRVVTHGVDGRLFDVPRGPRPEDRVLFLGNLSVPHNADAVMHLVRDIWPLVRRERPKATLVLAGADPSRAIQAFDGHNGIVVTGSLRDLIPTWSGSSLLLAPLRFATGIQNKVLEAMAAGVPVVTTAQVAEGVGAAHGDHLRVGADPNSLAAEVVGILRDPAASRDMTERARRFVGDRFTWDAQVRRLEELAVDVKAAGT